MTDAHYSSYAELLEKVEWEKYGVVNGVAQDSRCENCMVHCGYEPTASLGLNAQRGDTWKNDPVQLRPETEADRQGQRDRRLQRRDLRQWPSDRQTRRSLPRKLRDAQRWLRHPANLIALPSALPESDQPDIRPTNAELASAIARAQENLLRQQHPDGHWCRRTHRR